LRRAAACWAHDRAHPLYGDERCGKRNEDGGVPPVLVVFIRRLNNS
jgi:hypothetical protein